MISRSWKVFVALVGIVSFSVPTLLSATRRLCPIYNENWICYSSVEGWCPNHCDSVNRPGCFDQT